jgi:antitoxin ParD1/3/4
VAAPAPIAPAPKYQGWRAPANLVTTQNDKATISSSAYPNRIPVWFRMPKARVGWRGTSGLRRQEAARQPLERERHTFRSKTNMKPARAAAAAKVRWPTITRLRWCKRRRDPSRWRRHRRGHRQGAECSWHPQPQRPGRLAPHHRLSAGASADCGLRLPPGLPLCLAMATLREMYTVRTMSSRASVGVSLTPELTAYVAALVTSGSYRSATEVVRASLRLLQRREPAATTAPTPPTSDGTDCGARRRGRHGQE